MALKFWLGGEGSDKSFRLIEYILDEADKHPDRQYLYVVPEQFGLATQRELVLRSRNCGILNIDVLSFSRLAHRISDEVGSYAADVTLLDDMGKSLLIGMLASRHKKELPVFGDKLDRPGFTDRIKSVISEFMQYGITAEKAFELSENASAAGRGLLAQKLKDTALLYKLFKDHIKDRYTTVEETLDAVSSLVPHSSTISNSVVIFDGFTGFTPVQNKLIGVLMEYARDIHVALLLEDCIQDNRAGGQIKEHELFYLSRKTLDQLGRMADERHIITLDPYKADNSGLNNIRNIMLNSVYKTDKAPGKLNNTPGEEVRIFVGVDPYEEMTMTALRIKELIRERGYHYRDIAVLTGDLESYRHPIERQFARHDIPFFIDRTQSVMINPFIEYIRSFIDIICENYSITAVFRYLKSQLTGFDDEIINLLENYCLAANIKGYSKWHSRFDVRTKTAGPDELLKLNGVREAFTGRIDRFTAELSDLKAGEADGTGEGKDQDGNVQKGQKINAGSVFTVRQFSTALYHLIESDNIEEKLAEYARAFEEEGNRRLAGEYGRIYVQIVNILDELCELIPDEKTDIRGFGLLLDAGLSSIRIGVIPTGMDYVQAGDLTRSRFDNIKALFIVGANDGVIPAVSGNNDLINENEREFLMGVTEGLVLAPSSREDIYTQQLYIYMALCRPSDILFVSWSGRDAGGGSLLPSYLVGRIRNAYRDIRVERMQDLPDHYEDEDEAFDELMLSVVPALSGTLLPEKTERVRELLGYFLSSDRYGKRLEEIIDRQILQTGTKARDSIGAALARALYGSNLSANITNLEKYAQCAYSYFLRYGLKLNDREVFTVDKRDVGNMFHDCIKTYSDLVKKGNYDWADIPEDDRKRLMDEAVDKVMEKYMPRKLSTASRYTYMATRIRRAMHTTAAVVGAQIKQGCFRPAYFEVDFDEMGNLGPLNISLSEEDRMRLRGRIDRVDTYATEEGVYIRIIDYKSSGLEMDPEAIFEGRQLQLLVYLNVAMEGERARLAREGGTGNVIPAGVFYYHIDDPIIPDKGNADITEDEIHKKIMEALRLKGFVNSDTDILRMIDTGIDKDRLVVAVTIKKDGTLKETKQALSGEDLEALSEYADLCVRRAGSDIMSGNIAVPEADKKTRFTGPDCRYCDYRQYCPHTGKSAQETGYETADEETDDAANEAADQIKDKNIDWISLMKKTIECNDRVRDHEADR